MLFKIRNLRLRTIIGIDDWERTQKQEVIVNVKFKINTEKAIETDNIEHTINYKNLNIKIIDAVESSKFFLLEKLAAFILNKIMEDSKITWAKVTVDKPGSIRFAESVAVECEAERKN